MRLPTQLQRIRSQLAYLPRTWAMLMDAAGAWNLMSLLVIGVQGVLPTGVVVLTRQAVDHLVLVVDESRAGSVGLDSPSVSLLIQSAGLLAMTVLLTEVLNGLNSWIRLNQSERIQDHITGLIHQQSLRVDYEFYESAEFHNHLHQARDEAATRSLSLLENGSSLLQNGITLIAMGAVLLPYGVWLPLILLGSTLPALAVVVRFNQRYHRWWQQSTPRRRWTQYYDNLLTQSWTAAELRMFELGSYFQTAYQQMRLGLRVERIRFTRAQGLAQMSATGIAGLAAGASMAWMGWRVLQGQGTLGDLALFYQAFSRGQSLMRSLLSSMGQLYANILFLENLFEYLDLKPKLADPPDPVPSLVEVKEGIRFEQITFGYPGSDRPTLRDFSLTIPAGQIVAIVGANGAGKSTLIKLLCRLYDPQMGRVTVDGIDLRRMTVPGIRRLITVLFQTPIAYQATAAQNIAMGDLAAQPTQAEIEVAAKAAGADEVIQKLPQGYETPLGKWFGKGAELSGGEWQRITLAKAYLRRSPIIILDEPTSFLDLWAEADWLSRFRQLAQGRTALIITHRFSLAMRADRIHVMEAGQITESGNHDTLLQLNGRYAEAWKRQMQTEAQALPL